MNEFHFISGVATCLSSPVAQYKASEGSTHDTLQVALLSCWDMEEHGCLVMAERPIHAVVSVVEVPTG